MEKIAAVLRQHWMAAALLTAGLTLRVLAGFAYRPALFLDATRYLHDSGGNDPVGYEGPLRAILWVGNLDTVVAVQHLLGVAMAVVIYLVLLRRGAPRWLSALAIAPVLLDAYQLQNEQTILPGTFFQALIVTGFAFLLWQPSTNWRRTVSGGIALGTSAVLAQVGQALILPAVIYLVVAMAGDRWRQVIGKVAALCAAFALPILAYCTGSYLATGDFSLSHAGFTSLYGRVAAAADCSTLTLPPAERAMCPTKAQQAEGPDWLEYARQSPIASYYVHLPRPEVNRMIGSFNRSVLTQQPLRVLHTYSHDVLKLYAVVRTTSPGDTPIYRWQFQAAYPRNLPTVYTDQQGTIILALKLAVAGGPTIFRKLDTAYGSNAHVWTPGAQFLRRYQFHGGYTPGPLLLLALLAGLAGSLTIFRRRASSEQRQLALGALLFFSTGVAVLVLSDLFEFSWRYQLPALVTLPPAAAFGIAATIRFLRRRRCSRVAEAAGQETRMTARTG